MSVSDVLSLQDLRSAWCRACSILGEHGDCGAPRVTSGMSLHQGAHHVASIRLVLIGFGDRRVRG